MIALVRVTIIGAELTRNGVMLMRRHLNTKEAWIMNSPCDKTCKIYKGVCNGCGRTLQEIRVWSHSTPAEKKMIICKSIGRIDR